MITTALVTYLRFLHCYGSPKEVNIAMNNRKPKAEILLNAEPGMSSRIGCSSLSPKMVGIHFNPTPYHWQTLTFLIPLFHNPDKAGFRKPIAPFLLARTEGELMSMFEGFTMTPAKGWWWDRKRRAGIRDALIRVEVDGIFSANDVHSLRLWKKRIARRFKQDSIYMRLSPTGNMI